MLKSLFFFADTVVYYPQNLRTILVGGAADGVCFCCGDGENVGGIGAECAQLLRPGAGARGVFGGQDVAFAGERRKARPVQPQIPPADAAGAAAGGESQQIPRRHLSQDPDRPDLQLQPHRRQPPDPGADPLYFRDEHHRHRQRGPQC